MRKDIRPIKTKRSIKRALLALLNEKDISSITISELADRADISRKTFYLHYEDIKGVLDEIENDMASIMRESIVKDKNVGFRVRLINFINNLVEKIQTDEEYYAVIAESSYAKILFKNIDSIIRTELIQALNNETQLEPLHKVCLVDFIIGGIINTILNWVKTPNGPTLEEISNIIFEIISNNFTCYLNNNGYV